MQTSKVYISLFNYLLIKQLNLNLQKCASVLVADCLVTGKTRVFRLNFNHAASKFIADGLNIDPEVPISQYELLNFKLPKNTLTVAKRQQLPIKTQLIPVSMCEFKIESPWVLHQGQKIFYENPILIPPLGRRATGFSFDTTDRISEYELGWEVTTKPPHKIRRNIAPTVKLISTFNL